MHRLPITLLTLVATALAFVATARLSAADPAPEAGDPLDSIPKTLGPAKVRLGEVAELQLPAEFVFIGKGGMDQFYALTQNVRTGKEVGVVLAPQGWVLFFDYDPIGYVKDDEKASLDAAKLLSSLQEGQAAANSERKSRGYDAMRVDGWAARPHYDDATHYLKWAISLSSERDGYKQPWINHSVRILGRGGVMNVTLVTGPEDFATAEKESDAVLANYTYVPGETYAEFRKGDRIAQYGLAALVLGGGAALAAKTGFLAKFWKFIVAGVVALFAGIGKLWRAVTGSRTGSSGSPS